MNLPLDVDAYLALPLPTSPKSPPAATAALAPPDKISLGLALLAQVWPGRGYQHDAALWFSGGCKGRGQPEQETLRQLRIICTLRAGGDDAPDKREAQVRDSYAAAKPKGFKSLAEVVKDADTMWRAVHLLGLSNEIDLPDEFMAQRSIVVASGAPRRLPAVGHVYTHTPGVNAPREKLRKGVPMSDLVRLLLGSDEWAGVWQYDEFAKKLIAVDPPMKLDAETTGLSSTDVTAVGTWFEARGIATSDEQVTRAINVAAKACSFHPVREYLLGLLRPPAPTSLLDTLALRVLGNPSTIASTFLKLFLVAAVRRILWPGTKVDTMIVLYSPKEGRFKSTFVETLFGAQWTRDQMPSLDGRDASHALEGSWGIEIPELDKIMRAETSTTKEFLSRRTDKYRAFGTGAKVEYARQCVFIGTTNYPDFLESDTGNRRFWPIEVFGQIDLEFVRRHRDTIWAEAVTLALDPTVNHWLDETQEVDAATTRVSFDKRDIWHDAVEEYCRGKEAVDTAGRIYLEKIAVGEEGALARAPRAATNRISAILRKLGCASLTRRDSAGTVVRFWKISDALRNTPAFQAKTTTLFN